MKVPTIDVKGYGITPSGASWDRTPSFSVSSAGADRSPEAMKTHFQQFVAGTFYKSMLSAMRKTQLAKPLIHGGRTEEIFREHLDQTIAERIASAHGEGLSRKMYEQFVRRMGTSGKDAAARQGLAE